MFNDFIPATIQASKIEDPLFDEKEAELHLLRLDKLDTEISGNKWFKLKYNLIAAVDAGLDTILTFGGAYSNHIAATAAAGKRFGFKTIGIIRGEEPADNLNSTLSSANANGMKLHFVSRNEYREKNNQLFITSLRKRFGNFYLIPEGGNNVLGVKGCAEILSEAAKEFNYICCPCGTGTTLTGLILSAAPYQKIIGFSALKAEGYLEKEVNSLLGKVSKEKGFINWNIIDNFHFGGFGKVTDELLKFKSSFEKREMIELDYLYTSKMLYGIYKLIKNDFFEKGAKIIALHTGGLQGSAGFKKL